MPYDSLNINIYGATALIKSDHAELLKWLKFDFSHFVSPAVENPIVKIEATVGDPPWGDIPELIESMRSPEYVCFDQGDIRYVNYFGRALVRFDYTNETAQMYSNDPTYLYEKLYLLLLSRTGEWLDRRGIHRVHALGVAVDGKASLFLMPSGGGKSTLALGLLSNPKIALISEDTPLINSSGAVSPFPLRLGVSKSQIPQDAPSEFVREFHRERWGTKYLLHADYFKGKIASSPLPIRYIFSGKWINSETPRIERISRPKIFVTLMRDCVFGMGLPQIVEFFLSSNPKDLFRKSGIAIRRMATIFNLVMLSTPYRVLLSRNLAANREMVAKFLLEA